MNKTSLTIFLLQSLLLGQLEETPLSSRIQQYLRLLNKSQTYQVQYI